MKKNFASKLLSLWKNPFVKIIIYILALIGILVISQTVNAKGSEKKDLLTIAVELLTKSETISFFAAGIFTIALATIIRESEKRLEENLKIESNHHKIIAQYKGHKKDKLDITCNYFDKTGIYMELHHTQKPKKDIKNIEKDIYSSAYKSLEEELDLFNHRGVLILPTINLYTNILGNAKVSFEDDSKLRQLPDFIIGNTVEFIKAHKYSQMSNNLTIRLDDINVDGNEVKFHTSRSYYYHMLLTNRCMDYQLENGMSVRGVYEFGSKVSPLSESKLSNQIGINGMIITSDGYLLLEKRDRKKTTWKNKFAQPISLALKAEDLSLEIGQKMDNTEEYAENKLLSVIKKTIKGNFGFTEKDFMDLSLEKNFLGLARDLLEGGKPNLYFFVTLKHTAKDLQKILKENASVNTQKNALKSAKLSSKYYLVKYEDIQIDFNYGLKLKQNRILKVKRIVYPRCSRTAERWDNFKYFISRIFKRNIYYLCGEALLVTLSYLEICQERIEEIKGI